MKILVVDDDPIIRKLLFEVLTNDGHEVTLGRDGIEAVKNVESQSFGLVFMDVHMPRMNGLEALIAIRSLCPDLAVAMMDSYPDLLAQQAQGRGALTCMHKPFDLEEIRKIIREVESSILKEQ